MGTINFGTTHASNFFLGEPEVQKLYLGETEIWSNMQPLATPQNVSVSDTTATLSRVENAEKYEVFVDGNSIGEYSVTPTEYKVHLIGTGDTEASVGFRVYDGNDETGTLLGYFGNLMNTDVTILSGYICIENVNGSDDQINGWVGTGGVSANATSISSYFANGTVNADGTLTIDWYLH